MIAPHGATLLPTMQRTWLLRAAVAALSAKRAALRAARSSSDLRLPAPRSLSGPLLEAGGLKEPIAAPVAVPNSLLLRFAKRPVLKSSGLE